MVIHKEMMLRTIDRRVNKLDQIALQTGDIEPLIDSYSFRRGRNSLGFIHANAADLSSINDVEKSIPFTISTLNPDRDGDIVIPSGCLLEQYSRNPIVLWGHNNELPPIAVSRSPSGEITVYPEQKRIRAIAYFDEHDSDSMFIWGKIKRGFLNAASISFIPVEAERRPFKANRYSSEQPTGFVFHQYHLTEWSIVPVPANSDAIADALNQEKAYISPTMRKALEPYAAKAKGKCFSGWCYSSSSKSSKAPNQAMMESGSVNRFPESKEIDTPKEAEVLANLIRHFRDAVAYLESVEPDLDSDDRPTWEIVSDKLAHILQKYVAQAQEWFPDLDMDSLAPMDEQPAKAGSHRDEILERYSDEENDEDTQDVLDEYRRLKRQQIDPLVQKEIERRIDQLQHKLFRATGMRLDRA